MNATCRSLFGAHSERPRRVTRLETCPNIVADGRRPTTPRKPCISGIVRLFWMGLAILAAVLGWSTPALAQSLELTGNIDAHEIELGDTITYTLQATSTTNEAPSDPRLAPPAGFTVVDSSSSPTHMVSIVNGHRTDKHGLTASWRLRSDRLGVFTVGPASIAFAGGRRSGPPQRVTVVAPGSGTSKPRRPRRPTPFDPFDPFGGSPLDPFRGIFPNIDDDSSTDPFGGLSTDPKLALDSPRAPIAFLHATIDKARAVVGEQVTLTVYLYEDIRARQGRPTDVHEATATDFVKRSLLQDETRAIHIGHAIVGGQPWSVKLVRKNALFPIKTGRLSIGPMSLTLTHTRVGLRESETLHVDVTEPPVANRPAGYQIGDTGEFSLSAEATPRSIEQHGAVGVTVELRGNGNMPATLPAPEIAGVEWLEPQTRDSLGPASNEKFGGTRTFSYVVRIHKDGAVDLGEVRLPYFDPTTRTYAIARASLGIVQVTKAADRDALPEVAEPLLPNLPKVRTALEGKREETFLTERPIYWGAIFGSPLASVGGIVLGGALRKLRERRASAAPSPTRVARERRAEAEAAVKRTDGQAAVAAIARALEAAVLATTGINIRGTSSDGALRELEDAGVPETTAKATLKLLSECEDARFSPSGVTPETAEALWQRTKEVMSAVAHDRPETSAPPQRRNVSE